MARIYYFAFIFAVVDSNGQSEVVGFCILTSEDIENVGHMASVFKSHNLSWQQVQCTYNGR